MLTVQHKTSAEYKQIQRARKRKEGYVLKQIWVKPENWKEINKLIKGVSDESYQNKKTNS